MFKQVMAWLIFGFIAVGILITGADMLSNFELPGFGSRDNDYNRYQAQIQAERTQQARIEADRQAAQSRYEMSMAELRMDAADRKAERFQEKFYMFGQFGLLCIVLGMCVIVLAMCFVMLTHRQGEQSAERRFHERIAMVEVYRLSGMSGAPALPYQQNYQIPHYQNNYEGSYI